MKFVTKKMYRRTVLLVLVCMLSISYGVYGLDLPKPYQELPDYTGDARLLHALGLFKGTDIGFDLDRPSLRVEGAVMMVRLLGLEDEALSMRYWHPFTDVPYWASAYVGIMYEKGLTRGATATTFQSAEPLEGDAFATFVLRALGYSDIKGDFQWRDALSFCREIELIPPDEEWIMRTTFRRHEMVRIGSLALSSNMKKSTSTLLERLVELGAIDRNAAKKEVLWYEADQANEAYLVMKEALFRVYSELNMGDFRSDIVMDFKLEQVVEDDRLASQLELVYRALDQLIELAREYSLNELPPESINPLASAFEEVTVLLSKFKTTYRIKE